MSFLYLSSSSKIFSKIFGNTIPPSKSRTTLFINSGKYFFIETSASLSSFVILKYRLLYINKNPPASIAIQRGKLFCFSSVYFKVVPSSNTTGNLTLVLFLSRFMSLTASSILFSINSFSVLLSSKISSPSFLSCSIASTTMEILL